MVAVEEVKPDTQETNGGAQVQATGISIDLFRQIFLSLKEVNNGAFRTIGGKTVNSLPLEMDMELSDVLSKMEKMDKQYIASALKVISGYKCKVIPMESDSTRSMIVPPDEEKDNPDFMKKVTAELNVPIDFDVHKELPSFTRERFAAEKIDLADAPNKYIFFQFVLKR